MNAQAANSFEIPGLTGPVEILIDRWGVPHLYADSQDDLFLAQGFNAARDRLFQIDLWRRRGLGLLSEVFGAAVRRTRPCRAAVPLPGRHGRGVARVRRGHRAGDRRRSSDGVNAFVALCRSDPSHLPPEFATLGHQPAHWEPSDVARIRSHGLYYNLEDEVARALTLRDHGPASRTCAASASPRRTTSACPTGST